MSRCGSARRFPSATATASPSASSVWRRPPSCGPPASWPRAPHGGSAPTRIAPGRVKVGPDLSLPGHPEIFVIGDTALALDGDGQPLPGLAPVAKQQGAYVARLLRARLAGRPAPPPFRYRSYGTLATIGRRAAVADFGWIKLDGTVAWLLWGLVHISFLIGFRNRLVVMLDWIWSYVTFQSGARLITGPPDSR